MSSKKAIVIGVGPEDGFQFLYKQPRTAWSFEVDVRTLQEKW